METKGEQDGTKDEGEGCLWKEIHNALPHRTLGAIQVQYSTKLKK